MRHRLLLWGYPYIVHSKFREEILSDLISSFDDFSLAFLNEGKHISFLFINDRKLFDVVFTFIFILFSNVTVALFSQILVPHFVDALFTIAIFLILGAGTAINLHVRFHFLYYCLN
jgi:hypothetical protein